MNMNIHETGKNNKTRQIDNAIDVIRSKRFAAVFRSLDGEHQPVTDLLLPDEALEIRRTEPVIERTVAPIQLLA